MEAAEDEAVDHEAGAVVDLFGGVVGFVIEEFVEGLAFAGGEEVGPGGAVLGVAVLAEELDDGVGEVCVEPEFFPEALALIVLPASWGEE